MVKRTGFSSDVAFSPAVKSVQHERGSRATYGRMEQGGSWPVALTPDIKKFVESQTSVFFATASADGQPYIQHRGAKAGFLQVLDDRTIAFYNFAGNRQFISLGNLSENSKAQLFLIDYAQQRRIKIWGEASVIETTSELVKDMLGNEQKSLAEEVIWFRVTAWDENCRKYIPRRFEGADVARALAERDQKIARLETELEQIRSGKIR